MTQIDAEKSFQEKFHEFVVDYKKRPLADRLALMVKTGTISEEGRQRALRRKQKARKQAKAR